ncbi:MAG: hypothetical protein SGPRY_005858 [Prymnesium sp.]
MLFALLLAASFSPAARYRSPQRRAPTCVERIRLAASSWPQCPLPPCPFNNDEKSGGKSNATDKADGTGSPADAITRAAESLERSIQDTLSTSEPLACTAAEVAIESAFRVACEELASCNVTVKSGSSLRLLQGELDFASDVTIDPGNPLVLPPRLPNLASPATIGFELRFTQDDINKSPVLFNALQELLRELIRSGISSAIGAALPRDSESLQINLVRVEALEANRIVLVADAEATQSDGNRVQLRGMRVRTAPRASAGQRLVLLDRPELMSSFEGFGAKLEVGLPFLRAAGIPLPDAISIDRILVRDGAVQVSQVAATAGFATQIRAERCVVPVKPIDYEDLARSLQRLQDEVQQAASQQPVTVDVEASSEEPPSEAERKTLGPL